MSRKNGTMESAIQDRTEAHPDVVQMNEKELAAYETYLIAKEDLAKLEARKGQLNLDEKRVFAALTEHVAQYEKTIEKTRETLLAYNSRVMKNPEASR